MKIHSTELTIVYKIGGDLMQLRKDNILESTFTLSILDKDKEEYSGETSLEFDNINELRKCIDDFEIKYNNLKSNKILKNKI